jgi:predicted ribonuclease YlaK
VVRSLVATREIGFLPGDHDDKSALYQIPYKNMVKYMFQMPSDADFEMLYGNLKSQETVKFWSTSFIRGTTLDNSIIIVDEYQNLNFHELDSIITRVGENSRICFCGDATQSDLVKSNERNGIVDFMNILRKMDSFELVEFGIDDIVRSGLVKEYIIAKSELGL